MSVMSGLRAMYTTRPATPGENTNPVLGPVVRAGTGPNANGVTGVSDPNRRSTRRAGYQTYGGTGPFTGGAVQGTGFESKEARDAARASQIGPYGSQSGPGILESWFNQRATGTDPAFEYAARRGMEDLGNRYGAAGLGNSGAARQGESDFYANLVAQRMGQLDALAGGAAGEHQNRVNSMFQQGMGLAQGQAGLASAYDLGAAGNMDAATRAQMQMNLNKAGVDAQGNQRALNNIAMLYGMGQGRNTSGNPYAQ